MDFIDIFLYAYDVFSLYSSPIALIVPSSTSTDTLSASHRSFRQSYMKEKELTLVSFT